MSDFSRNRDAALERLRKAVGGNKVEDKILQRKEESGSATTRIKTANALRQGIEAAINAFNYYLRIIS
jgi:hypothetical protein